MLFFLFWVRILAQCLLWGMLKDGQKSKLLLHFSTWFHGKHGMVKHIHIQQFYVCVFKSQTRRLLRMPNSMKSQTQWPLVTLIMDITCMVFSMSCPCLCAGSYKGSICKLCHWFIKPSSSYVKKVRALITFQSTTFVIFVCWHGLNLYTPPSTSAYAPNSIAFCERRVCTVFTKMR